jgi:UDP:flavonoid glycosyltransferase YjiC (YdhE family)
MIRARRPPLSRRRSVAFICMPETGHFQRLQTLISGLHRSGIAAHVFTHRKFAQQVKHAGGVFFDLFSKYPLEQADDMSFPIPCRYVSFAAKYADQVRIEVEKTGASLLIHDTFAVIGRIVSELLGIPRINVCSGHNVAPARFLEILREDTRVRLSPECLLAVEILRDSYGVADASPFSYVSSLSPHLNIYCEPPEFLEKHERQIFEPLAFYGSLPSLEEMEHRVPGNQFRLGPHSAHALKVYISFGTVIWRYFTAEALRALTNLATVFAKTKNMRTIISLGGASISSKSLATLVHLNVSVESYVDQWTLLQEADAFVTHHGMNSTHEAIFHRVPMISYPFFWDQPALAKKCQQFGLSIPLADSPQGAFSEDDIRTALARLADERESMRAALSRAHEWEKAVIDNRSVVLQQVVDLME